jgi:hypothetical protein
MRPAAWQSQQPAGVWIGLKRGGVKREISVLRGLAELRQAVRRVQLRRRQSKWGHPIDEGRGCESQR